MSGTQEQQKIAERLPQNDVDLRFDFGTMVECESGRDEEKQHGAVERGFEFKHGYVDGNAVDQRIHER